MITSQQAQHQLGMAGQNIAHTASRSSLTHKDSLGQAQQ